ncbi:hypothetical protein C0Q70_19932 [Pomacea canaliculata]|uniref:G-protein coupled receptors family 1 profile domain-containing protein n=1 Tax=Pomacea canaliculata TaxID=400727 RepID=A0A2T7NE47_POMCA|nr:uncharacterized protein LOC112554631 [Pomacea canaliculata]PVD19443.1 hypothetical protein C0Q70_19932 [Pomacea canaliculata]
MSSSTNTTFGNVFNGTFATRLSDPFEPQDGARFINALVTSILVVDSLLAVLIISTNLVLLVVLLSKPSFRSCLRNRLLVSLVVSNLIVGLLGCPVSADFARTRRWVHSCSYHIIHTALTKYVQNFVVVWGMILLLVNYLCRLKSYTGPAVLLRLPPRVQTCVTILFVLLPWIIAISLTGAMTGIGLHRLVLKSWNNNWCPIFLEPWATVTMSVIIFALPAILLVVVLAVVLVVYRRQTLTRSASGTILGDAETRNDLDDRSPVPERPWVHVAAALLCIIMMAGEEIGKYALKYSSGSWQRSVAIFEAMSSLADLLTFVLALLWLLALKDVRARALEILAMVPVMHCRVNTSRESSPANTTSVTFKTLREED